MIFSSRKTYPAGLDISDKTLRLVQLTKAGNKIKVQALNKLNLEKGLIEFGEIKDEEAVSKKIKELFSKPMYGKFNPESIIACLPETKTFIKLIEVDKSPNDIVDVIEGEIEKHIPFSVSEVYYDWQIIEENENKYSILIGATPKKIVNQYTNLLNRTKLTIQALEIEPISICRGLLQEESPNFPLVQGKNQAIIDIGANRTSLIIYSKNTILFTVSMPLSGNKITDEISTKLEIDREQAEKAKIICGLDSTKAEGVINKLLSDMIEELKKKIKDAISYYNNYYNNRGHIDKILLTGGGANIKGLAEIIKESTGIETFKADLFINNIDKNEKLLNILKEDFKFNGVQTNLDIKNNQIVQDNSLTFSTAFGLALRGIFINEL